MPRRGYKKKVTDELPKTHLEISLNLYNEIERIAAAQGLINPRTGKGNRIKMVELAIHAFKLYSREYSDGLTYPRKLTDLLLSLEVAVEKEDWEAVKEAYDQISEAREYLESWSEPSFHDFKKEDLIV